MRSYEIGVPESDTRIPEIWMMDENQIAVSFVTRTEAHTLAHRGLLHEPRPFKLRILVFDLATRSIIRQQTVPSETNFAGIICGTGNSLVVRESDRLTLFSEELQSLKTYQMPKMTSEYVQYKNHYASPGCKSVLFLNSMTGFNVVLSTETLAPVNSWPRLAYADSISDDSIVASGPIFLHGRPTDLLYQDGKSSRICSSKCGIPRFISDDLIVLYSGDTIELRRTTGQIEFTDTLESKDLVWSVTPAPDGKSFAALIYRHKGGSALLDISPDSIARAIIIYEVAERHRKVILDLRPLLLKTGSLTGIAIAPNGSRIALLHGASIDVLNIAFPDTKTKP